MRKLLTAAALLFSTTNGFAAMTPPSMAFNVAPRPAISGLAVPSGEGLGFNLTARQSSRERLWSGSSEVSNPGNERLETWRLNAQFDYEFRPRLSVILAVPYVFNRFSARNVEQSYRALGDITVIGRWAIHHDRPREPRTELSALAGIKFPTGSTSVMADGIPLAATQQPGSGTTDFILGAAGFRVFDRASLYGALSYKYNLHSAYSFGNQLTADAGILMRVADRFSLTGELNAEIIEKDRAIEAGPTVRADGVVTNTGGQAFYVSPGIQWRLARGLSLSAAVQLPLYQYLNGTQLGSGPNYLFGAHTRFR